VSKKLGFGLIGLLVAGAIYYFTTGSTLLASEIQKQVNTELIQASKHGFKIEEHKVDDTKEHFVLSFDDPVKITQFLNTQGIHTQRIDAENLKGLKLGVDIAYLANVYSSVSIDLYPLTLPLSISSSPSEPKSQDIIKQIATMLTKKTLLVHVDINKLGTGFKGYVKDINETIHDDFMTKILLQGLTFEGSLKAHKFHKITQNLKELKVVLDEKITISLQGMKANYLPKGKTSYDYETSYSIDTIQINVNAKSSVSLINTNIFSTSKVHDNLMTASMLTNTKNIYFKNEKITLDLDAVHINTKVSNLDISAFEKLQEIDPNNQDEIAKILQQLVSKGVRIDIQNISAQNIHYGGRKLDDFNLSAYLDIDKSLNITALQQNPLLALSTIDANLKLSLAPALFALIAEQPKAMMILMLFQPQDVNGKKVYGVELKDGKLTVNGMSVM
jgi:hypothetical protein